MSWSYQSHVKKPTWNTGRYDDDISAGQSLLQTILLGQETGYSLSASVSPHVYVAGPAPTAGVEMWDKSAATPGVLTTS